MDKELEERLKAERKKLDQEAYERDRKRHEEMDTCLSNGANAHR